MNNLFLESPSSLRTNYSLLKAEIMNRQENEREKDRFLQNLESAYIHVTKDILEWEEEINGD